MKQREKSGFTSKLNKRLQLYHLVELFTARRCFITRVQIQPERCALSKILLLKLCPALRIHRPNGNNWFQTFLENLSHCNNPKKEEQFRDTDPSVLVQLIHTIPSNLFWLLSKIKENRVPHLSPHDPASTPLWWILFDQSYMRTGAGSNKCTNVVIHHRNIISTPPTENHSWYLRSSLTLRVLSPPCRCKQNGWFSWRSHGK